MPNTVDVMDIFTKVKELNQHYSKLMHSLLNEESINQSGIKLIEIIADKQMTLKEITSESGLDKSTVSRQMNALVESEFVQKQPGKDKRYVQFVVANEAKTQLEQHQSKVEAFLEHTLSGWTEEEKQMLTVLLGRLNRSLNNELK